MVARGTQETLTTPNSPFKQVLEFLCGVASSATCSDLHKRGTVNDDTCDIKNVRRAAVETQNVRDATLKPNPFPQPGCLVLEGGPLPLLGSGSQREPPSRPRQSPLWSGHPDQPNLANGLFWNFPPGRHTLSPVSLSTPSPPPRPCWLTILSLGGIDCFTLLPLRGRRSLLLHRIRSFPSPSDHTSWCCLTRWSFFPSLSLSRIGIDCVRSFVRCLSRIHTPAVSPPWFGPGRPSFAFPYRTPLPNLLRKRLER